MRPDPVRPPEPCGIVTVLTDFGAKDPFVGIMKGVILSRHRGATVVDLCHGIAPQDVTEGAFWLERSYPWFPPGSVHLAVVDPGVGSARAPIAVSAGGHYFVGPDNGLFSGPLRAAGAVARVIDVVALQLPQTSRTFHGRDVFAPVAAELASGRLPFAAVGPEHGGAERARLPACERGPASVHGEVVTIDHYGNLITNIEAAVLEHLGRCRARIGSREVGIGGTYSDVNEGELIALINAFSVLEIAVRQGSAERSLGLGRGAPVEVQAQALSGHGEHGASRKPASGSR